MLSDDEKSKIYEAIKSWYSHPRSKNKVIAIEKDSNLNIKEEILGKVDRVEADEDGQLRMIDYKSEKNQIMLQEPLDTNNYCFILMLR